MAKTSINGIIMYSLRHPFKGDVKNVFAPDFFEYRLRIFREITLHSLATQTDKDFNIFILHSDSAPQNYRDVFAGIADEFPFIQNVWVRDGEYSYGVPSADDVEFENGTTITFRIDNDDALHMNFIKDLRRYLNPEFVGMCVGWPEITILQRMDINKYMISKFDFPMNSIGLAYISGRDNYKNILNLRGSHNRLYQSVPSILVPGTGGLQIINGENVSNRMWRRGDTYSGDDAMKCLKSLGYSGVNISVLKSSRLELRKHGGPIRRLFFHIGKSVRAILYK